MIDRKLLIVFVLALIMLSACATSTEYIVITATPELPTQTPHVITATSETTPAPEATTTSTSAGSVASVTPDDTPTQEINPTIFDVVPGVPLLFNPGLLDPPDILALKQPGANPERFMAVPLGFDYVRLSSFDDGQPTDPNGYPRGDGKVEWRLDYIRGEWCYSQAGLEPLTNRTLIAFDYDALLERTDGTPLLTGDVDATGRVIQSNTSAVTNLYAQQIETGYGKSALWVLDSSSRTRFDLYVCVRVQWQNVRGVVILDNIRAETVSDDFGEVVIEYTQ